MGLRIRALAATALLFSVTSLASPLAAQSPVVVELFTSQGCSSCPPADEFMHTLAAREDVIALALHVDYWDYIGWKDVFGSPVFSARQKAYAVAGKRRSVYTPQMIVEGRDPVVGNHPMDVTDLIRRHAARADRVTLNTKRSGGKIVIEAKALNALDTSLNIQLVRYRPEATVDIKRGENAGRSISYVNIVTDWRSLGEWDGKSPLRIEADAKGSDPVVVILQAKGYGPIEAAARLK